MMIFGVFMTLSSTCHIISEYDNIISIAGHSTVPYFSMIASMLAMVRTKPKSNTKRLDTGQFIDNK